MNSIEGRHCSIYEPGAVEVQQHCCAGGRFKTKTILVGSGSRRLRLGPAERKDPPGGCPDYRDFGAHPALVCQREWAWITPRAWAERRAIAHSAWLHATRPWDRDGLPITRVPWRPRRVSSLFFAAVLLLLIRHRSLPPPARWGNLNWSPNSRLLRRRHPKPPPAN